MAGSDFLGSRADYAPGEYDARADQQAQQRLWQSSQTDQSGGWRGTPQQMYQAEYYHRMGIGLRPPHQPAPNYGDMPPQYRQEPQVSIPTVEINMEMQENHRARYGASSRVAQVYNACRDAVVKIESETGRGTGFFINKQGELVTDYHVIEPYNTNDITVTTTSGKKYKATLEAVDRRNDLAVLKVDTAPTDNITALPLGSSNLRRGEGLMGLGHPRGANEVFASPGHFIRVMDYRGNRLAQRDMFLRGMDPNRPFLQMNMNVEHGESGGPVVNAFGQVVGIMERREDSSISAATPVEALERLLINMRQAQFEQNSYYRPRFGN